jgi:hypothetical protein
VCVCVCVCTLGCAYGCVYTRGEHGNTDSSSGTEGKLLDNPSRSQTELSQFLLLSFMVRLHPVKLSILCHFGF